MNTSLLLPKSKAEEEIRKRLENGQGLLNRKFTTHEELTQVLNEHRRWRTATADLLGELFSDYSMTNYFNKNYHDLDLDYQNEIDYQKLKNTYKQSLEDEIERLKFILHRIPFTQEKVFSNSKVSLTTSQVASSPDVGPSSLKLPEKVTLSWLFHNFPIGYWLALGGLLIGSFAFGVKVGQLDWVQALVGNQPSNTKAMQSESSLDIAATIKQLTDAHNTRLDELNKKFVAAQNESIEPGHIDINKQAYINAAKRYEEAIKQENESFTKQLSALRQIREESK